MLQGFNFRYDDKIRRQISNTVRSFNAKVTRTSRKVGDEFLQFIPDRVSVQELVSRAIEEKWTRKEMQKELKSLQRFLQKGSEEVVKVTDKQKGISFYTTKYNKKEYEIAKRVDETRKTRLRKNMKPEQGLSHMTGSENLNKSKSKPKSEFEMKLATQGLKQRNSNYYKNEKLRMYKDNYLRAIYNNLGNHGAKIVSLLKDVAAQTIFNGVVTAELDIDFVYSIGVEKQALADRIFNEWKEILTGNKVLEEVQADTYEEDFVQKMNTWEIDRNLNKRKGAD